MESEREWSAFCGWKYRHYFDFIAPRAKNIVVRCRLCPGNKTFSTAKNSTSNLLKHLKGRHCTMALEERTAAAGGEPSPPRAPLGAPPGASHGAPQGDSRVIPPAPSRQRLYSRHVLRALVAQRLTAAVDDICALFERTIAEYEQEVLFLHISNSSQQQRPSSLQPSPEDTTDVEIVSMGLKQESEDLPYTSVIVKTEEDEDESLVLPHKMTVGDEDEPSVHPHRMTVDDEDEPSVLNHRVPEDDDVLHQRMTVDNVEESLGLPHQAPEVSREEANSEQTHRERTKREKAAHGGVCGAGCSSDPHEHSDAEDFDSDVSERTDLSEDWLPENDKPQDHDSPPRRVFPVTDFRPFCCSDCGKAFRNKTDLKRHTSVHTGERPHKCSLCEKRFKDKGNLTKHVRVHTGEKPYTCSLCSERFCWKSLLNVHMTRHYGNIVECSVCDKRFPTKSALQVHMKTHSNERPLRCAVCKADFNHKDQLQRHMLMQHTEAMP